MSIVKTIYQERYQQLIFALVDARHKKGLTQAQLAKLFDKPQSYIAKIEAKDRKLDVMEFIDICTALDIQASEIVEKIQNNLH